jgi:biofilm protein TabA
MIIDTLKNAEKYFCVHPLFEKAFEYLKSIDLEKIEAGKYSIDGDQLSAIVSVKPGKTVEESIAKFECHNKHIDIQICIKGKEHIGWKARQDCVEQRGEYNSEKDVLFFDDVPDMYFQLTDKQFAIFFPEDVHAPMIGKEEIKKLVVKVRI